MSRGSVKAPRVTRLEEFLCHHAINRPRASAIEDEDGTVDYQTTLRRAKSIARGLVRAAGKYGVRLDQNPTVGICLQQGANAIVGLLGVLMAGCCYVPLLADAGMVRLRRAVEISRVEIVLVDENSLGSLTDKLRMDGVACPRFVSVEVLLADDSDAESDMSLFRKERVDWASHAAYTLFSSGTTGVPKGIVMSHASVLHYVTAVKDIFHPDPNDRWLHAAPYTFDVSVEEIFIPLSVGACIVCQPRQGLQALTEYLSFLEDSRITAVSMPTALWHRLSVHLEDNTGDEISNTLRLVVIGGEAARVDAYRQWSSAMPSHRKVKLVNAYGPTECCVSTTFGVEFNNEENEKVLNIGQPVEGMKAYIVERDTNTLVSDGQVGRLLLSGPQLALEYIGDEMLTEKKFFPNPFEDGSVESLYGRVYDTGDLVVRRPTGELDFRARIDRQIQVRGQRVEAEGVESVLASCKCIAEASIIVIEEQQTDAMVAFLVGDDCFDEETVLREAKDCCMTNLMPFERPSRFMLLPELPLTANGKIDKPALTEIYTQKKSSGTGTRTASLPLTDTMKTLADLWKEVLGYQQPSFEPRREDTLVELGGHSLTFVALTSKIYKSFKLRVTVTSLIRHQQLSEMANYLDKLPRNAAVPPTGFNTTESCFDLSIPQEQLYLAQSKEPDSPFLNDGVAIELEGAYEFWRLEKAIQRIVQRHDALRCVLFRASDHARVQQRLLPWSEALWKTIWQQHDVRAEDLQSVSSDLFSIPLDLFQGPLIKIHLIKVHNEDRSVLIVQAHHICWDGFSDGIFLEELMCFYKDLDVAMDMPAALRVIHQSLASQDRTMATQELIKYINNVPETINLPADLAPPPNKSYSRGDIVRFKWGTQLVYQSTAGRSIKPTSLALAIFAVVIRRFAGGQSDFALGIPMANRTTPEAASSIGFFVNMLPFRLKANEKHLMSDVLDMVEAGLATLLRNQDGILADAYHDQRENSSSSTHERLLKFCFSFQDAPEGSLSERCSFKRWPLHNGAARADLTCFTELCVDGTISGELEYDADLFERGTIVSLSDCMAHVLQTIASNPENWHNPLERLDLAPSQARDDKLAMPSTANPNQPMHLGTHILQALESHLQQIAIVDHVSGCQLTYAELASRAKFLARTIHNCAKNGDGGVLLLLSRSWETPVAQIASALAGRPWICCDVGQPKNRIRSIIDQAKPSCVIAHREAIANLFADDKSSSPVIFVSEMLTNGWDDVSGILDCDGPAYSPAYIIYTSGTTGAPKGVVIEQNSFIAFLDHIRSLLTQSKKLVALNSILTSNTAFDGSLSQMYAALTTGGQLIIAKHGGEQDGEYIATTMEQYDINYLCTTTAAVRLWLTQTTQSYPIFFGHRFCYLLLGGDELPPRFVSNIFSRCDRASDVQVMNVYGPTEGTIFSSYGTYKISDISWLESRRRSPIDTILPNATISIVSPDMQNLPVGAVGEIVIWGPCLAREYINLPELNNAKFVNLHGNLRGWRTGDLGRWTVARGFEVLGRMDSMRKVLGGFRVDVEEIKLVVLGHERVRECEISTVVEEKDEGVKETKLVAHMVLRRPVGEDDVLLHPDKDLEVVSNWKTMFTGVNLSLEEYREEKVDLTFDYRGWASSFDRSEIPKADMKEWVDCTTARLLEQDCFKGDKKPSVAEIGCGTGMILFSIVHRVENYYGTDLAQPTVAQVQSEAQRSGHDHVRTAALPAHEFDSALDRGTLFDLIICNSVAQYFPSLDYLDKVIRRARARLAPGGVLFMGDIRHRQLMVQHAATSAFYRGARTVAELQKETVDILDKDNELQVDPAFFIAMCGAPDRLFPGASLVELRRGRAPTEMTMFRYDAILTLRASLVPSAKTQVVKWGRDKFPGPPALPFLVPSADADADVIVFTDLPNKRLQTSDRLREYADSMFKQYADDCQVSSLLLKDYKMTQMAWDPEEVVSQVRALGYRALILASPQSAVSFDLVVFRPPYLAAARSWAHARLSSHTVVAASEPHEACRRKPLSSQDRNSIFLHLFHRVPRYMIPHYAISVSRLPLSGTGKVDTRRLPQPRSHDLFTAAASAQRDHSIPAKIDASMTEETVLLAQSIAVIFDEVLGRRSCGKRDAFSIQDDFFFSGGHSIVAAEAVQLIRSRLNLVVPFTAILTHPTPAALALRLMQVERFQDQARDVPSPMVLLHPQKTVSPLLDIVVIHPIGGGLLPMAGLVDGLGKRLKDARILGLPWSEEHTGAAQTIGQLAQTYGTIISEFCAIRAGSQRKLVIVGWSFGGTLTFETSKHLQLDSNIDVKIILLDAPTVEAAVYRLDSRVLAAENYAEHIVEYIDARSRANDVQQTPCLSSRDAALANPMAQTLSETFTMHSIDEKTDLHSLPTLVRKTIHVPAWVSDTDIVAATRALQKSLQILVSTHDLKDQKSALISDKQCISALLLQAKDGLCTRLSDGDLGWKVERERQGYRLDLAMFLVEGDHEGILADSRCIEHISRWVSSSSLES